MSECPICGRTKTKEFCEYHQTAYDNLKENHRHWQEAVDLTWEEYLIKILDLEETGAWVKEVADHIIQEDDP